MDRVIYITGGSSNIGKILRKKLSNSGYIVYVLSRNKIRTFSNEYYLKYNLGDRIYPIKGNYEHIIFHLAHDYYDRKIEKNSNVHGLRKIIKSFENLPSKKIVFISTADCSNPKSTIYISQKKISESLLDLKKDLIVRPSLIFSDNDINKLFKKLPKFGVPIPINRSRIAPMNIEKFCGELYNLVLTQDVVGITLILGQENISLKDFIYKKYKIKTFNVYNSLWLILISLLKFTQIPMLFYLSERILGFIYLRDIETIKEDEISKRYI